MYTSTSVSHDLAQARIADLRHQARRTSVARTAAHSAQPGRPRVLGHHGLRSVFRHRAAAAASQAR
jgi:hypothetical protein